MNLLLDDRVLQTDLVRANRTSSLAASRGPEGFIYRAAHDLKVKWDHRTWLVEASAIGYDALHATITSGRVRLATDGGAKIAR
jgi:hypothetical protein